VPLGSRDESGPVRRPGASRLGQEATAGRRAGAARFRRSQALGRKFRSKAARHNRCHVPHCAGTEVKVFQGFQTPRLLGKLR